MKPSAGTPSSNGRPSVNSSATTPTADLVRVDVSTGVSVPRGCRVASSQFVPWNNPRNLLSASTAETCEVIIYCVLMPLLVLLGLTANSLSAAVFYKLGLKKGINLCLFLLALSDLLFLLTKTMTRMSKVMLILSMGGRLGKSRWDFTMATYHLIKKSELFLFYSNYLTTVASLERCVSIVRPFKAGMIFTHRVVLFVLIFGFLVALTFFVLVGFRNEAYCVFLQREGLLLWAIGGTDLYRSNRTTFDIIYNLVLVFLFPVLSLGVVVTSTCVIIYKLHAAAKWRLKTAGDRGREERAGAVISNGEMQLYKMLVAVAILHIVCTLPTFVKEFGKLVDRDFQNSGHYSNFFTVMVAVKDLAASVNGAVNVFVYFSNSAQFRHSLHTLLASCCCQQSHHHVSVINRQGPSVRGGNDVTDLQ